jgi:sulfatase modifying factor 1
MRPLRGAVLLGSLAAAAIVSADVDPIYRDGFQAFACSIGDNPTPNSGAQEEPGTGGCPAGMVAVATFCIDRYEAALLDITVPGAPVSWSPYRNPGTTTVRAISARFAVPQGYINGVQAQGACTEAGKRLCTDQEWLRACRGPGLTTYPYGNTRIPGQCNDARSVHPAVEYFGTTDPWIWNEIGHPCLNQLWRGLDRVGANPGCVSAEGPYDMMGNLHEWTDAPAGTFRGGYYVDTALNGDGCLYATTAHDTSHWDFSTGFRCCADR